MYFSCLFLYYVPCYFYVIRFCCKSTVVFLRSFFHIFPKDFTIFNIICCCCSWWRLQTSFVFARYIYSLCNSVILVFLTVVFNWKTSLENVKEGAEKWVKHVIRFFYLYKQIPMFIFSSRVWKFMIVSLLNLLLFQRKFVYCCIFIFNCKNFGILVW